MRHLNVMILSIIMLSACNQPTTNKNLSDSINSIDTNEKGFSDFGKLVFEGDLKAKKPIPIVLEISKNGNELTGQMLYKKIGEPIPLKGTIDEAGTIKLHETVNGEITGHYEGQIQDKQFFNGLWTSGNKKTDFEYSLNISDNEFATFVKAKESYTGLYEIKPKNKEADFYYMFQIEQLNDNEIKFLFFGNIGKVSYNHGSIEGIASLEDGIATYKDGNCMFRLIFSKKGLKAEYLEEANPDDCGMGARVYVQGDYVKTNSDKPDFVNPME